MTNECDIVRDLLPLYSENMASENSVKFIDEHLERCEDCRAELEKLEKNLPEQHSENDFSALKKALKKLRGRFEILMVVITVFTVFIGVNFTVHDSMLFYNIIIMPIIGIFGYVIMRWRALYNIPLILILATLVQIFVFYLSNQNYYYSAIFSFLIFYIPLSIIGVIIAGLYAFAFRKEDKNDQ